MTPRTLRIPGWLLALLFFGVPLLEIIVLIQVGRTIGIGWTILLLIADSIFGAWLIKREGRRAMAAFTAALSSGRMPAREIADGMLILVGGTLMLAPGFVTDVFGMLLILPFTRPLARRGLTRLVASRLVAGGPGFAAGAGFPPPAPGPATHPGQATRPGPDVVRGEVVDEE